MNPEISLTEAMREAVESAQPSLNEAGWDAGVWCDTRFPFISAEKIGQMWHGIHFFSVADFDEWVAYVIDLHQEGIEA